MLSGIDELQEKELMQFFPVDSRQCELNLFGNKVSVQDFSIKLKSKVRQAGSVEKT